MKFVTMCDQDAGNYLMKDNETYCLVLINPAPEVQRVNVTVSFNSSVFEFPFTSDNKPGGNSASETLYSISLSNILLAIFGCILVFGFEVL